MASLAFVFGSNGNAKFGQLAYAESDAAAFEACLRSDRCGFETKLADAGADAYQIRKLLDATAAQCQRADTFVCYFAGHGVLEAGELFFVLRDSTDALAATALAAEDVLASMRRCKAANRLLILDCCHAGGAVGFRGGAIPLAELPIASANHLVLVASGRLEKAREIPSLGGGFLTSRIIAALSSDFHEADSNVDLRLSLTELMRYLEQHTASHNAGRAWHKLPEVPTPYLFGETKGPFYLTREVTWKPYELEWPDGTQMVLLPIPPIQPGGKEHHFAHYFENIPEIPEGGFGLALGKNLITNAQYRRFVAAGGPQSHWRTPRHQEDLVDYAARIPVGQRYNEQSKKWEGPFYPWQEPGFCEDDKPVVCVSFDNALSYARWVDELASKKLFGTHTNLPPYRVWQFAALGTPHLSHDPALWRPLAKRAPQRSPHPAPTDSEGARSNERGISDLIGNVWEWCGSMNGLLQRAGFPCNIGSRGEEVTLRGASFLDSLDTVRPYLSEREIPDRRASTHNDHGFRLAALIPFANLPREVRASVQLFPPIDIAQEIHAPPTLEGNDF